MIRPSGEYVVPDEPVEVPWIPPAAAESDGSAQRVAAAPSIRRLDGAVPEEASGVGTGHSLLPGPSGAPAGEAGLEGDSSAPAQGSFPLAWQDPIALKKRLATLTEEAGSAVRDWAADVERAVDRLGTVLEDRPADGRAPPTTAALAELHRLADAAAPVAAGLEDRGEATRLRRAAHALRRRTEVWQRVVGLWSAGAPASAGADPEQVALCIAKIERLTADSPEGPVWREYLLLDALRGWAEQRAPGGDQADASDNDADTTAEAVKKALRRLSEEPLTMAQREFLERPPLTTLKAELRREAAAPVDPSRLLVKLERYELSRWTSEAARVAADQRRLAVSSSAERRRLGRELERHYRNANVRITAGKAFLKRLMPEPEPERAPVHDVVRGVPVHGRSTTRTEVDVTMLPDPHRLTLVLAIRGRIDSLTRSNSGPATFWSNSRAWYVAEKPLEIDLHGIHLRPAEVWVSNSLRLRDVRTDFERLPLIGPLAEKVARSGHARNRAAANAEIRYKIRRKAKRRIDTEVDARLGELSRRLRQKLLEPMHRLRLDPVMIDAGTTEQRFVMRVRLAGEDQLGSHTPRPRAPSNALVSFQIHESAINNALARLELAGETFTLGELKNHLEDRLERDDLLHVPPDQYNVAITFARRDPLVVRFQDGKMSVALSIAKLRKGFRSWKDFTVRVFYKPEPDGLSAELRRDGVIQLIGDRLRLGGQIALRGVFARTFSKRRPVRLTPHRLVGNPTMEGIEVTQLTVDDGWVGVALAEGPAKSSRTAALRKPLRR
ncbi:MAG: hypothetical protein ACOC46_00845 [Pirellulales bacterium]